MLSALMIFRCHDSAAEMSSSSKKQHWNLLALSSARSASESVQHRTIQMAQMLLKAGFPLVSTDSIGFPLSFVTQTVAAEFH
jgi:hypothetical protein